MGDEYEKRWSEAFSRHNGSRECGWQTNRESNMNSKPSPFSKKTSPPQAEITEFANKIVDSDILTESNRKFDSVIKANRHAASMQEKTKRAIDAWFREKDPVRKEKRAIEMSALAQSARNARLEAARLKRESAEHDEMMARWPF
jgi:hypothetical protein